MRSLGSLTIMAAMATGCSFGTSISYLNPVIEKAPAYATIVNKSYDDTWLDLIDHLSHASFAIDNVVRDSGLITLRFSANAPQEYVDCGAIEAKEHSGRYYSGDLVFSGPYAEYLAIKYNASLSGWMNIFVRSIAPERTMVRVHARYVFDQFSFDSGSYDDGYVWIEDKREMRRCQPTYKAERTILDAVKNRGRPPRGG